jgi:hypothetical protein
MFILVMDRSGGASWYVTIHANRAEAEQAIKKYARWGFSEKCEMDDEWPDNEWPETLADCIKWLAAGGEHVHLFRAERGGGLGEEVILVEAKTDSLDLTYSGEPAQPAA